MSRSHLSYQLIQPPQIIFDGIHSFLISKGYSFKTENNEQVYKKGHGIITLPKYIKISTDNFSMLHIEAWLDWVFLPGISFGTLPFDDGQFLGAIPKNSLKKDVSALLAYIFNSGFCANPAPYYNGRF